MRRIVRGYIAAAIDRGYSHEYNFGVMIVSASVASVKVRLTVSQLGGLQFRIHHSKGGSGMRKIVMAALGVVFLSTAFAGVALAQTTGQYPNVANLKPFTAEAAYMSLPGYLRYIVYQQTSQWLSRPEAVRIVTQQL